MGFSKFNITESCEGHQLSYVEIIGDLFEGFSGFVDIH